MSRRAGCRTAFTAFGALCLGAGLLAQGQVFRGGTDTVFLSLTVTDAEGHFVRGLDQKAFEVFEDGRLQDIATFAHEPQPIALSLLLDTSTSMEPKLGLAQRAAIGFVRRMQAGDVAQVVDFNSRVSIAQTFTADPERLETAIRLTQAGGSTSLYNALSVAFAEHRQQGRSQSPGELRREAVLVLSDGEDTTSLIDYEEVLDMAKRTEIIVYAIGVRVRAELAALRGFSQADFVLRTLSQETGGRAFFVQDPFELGSVYDRISEELANQYLIGYSSKNAVRDGGWRRIHVRVLRPGVTARTKSGYYAPTERR